VDLSEHLYQKLNRGALRLRCMTIELLKHVTQLGDNVFEFLAIQSRWNAAFLRPSSQISRTVLIH
jgi:hypothetical protein